MPENTLFYIIFLSQIILISFYYPRKILRRVKYVLEKHPPAEYPKLYPKPIEYYKKGQTIYKFVNHTILFIGFVLIIAVGVWDNATDLAIQETIPVVYFMIQITPVILIEISGFAYFKLMRKADLRTTRKTELFPRRLFDFVSPIIVGAAIFMYIACILFFYSINQLQFDWSNDTFIILVTLTATNLLYAGIIYWNLNGKKLDPYQSVKDRKRQIEVTVKSLFFISIIASLFLIIMKGIDQFHLDYLEASIMSLYLQLIVLMGLGSALRSLRLENIDFEVYKEDAPAL